MGYSTMEAYIAYKNSISFKSYISDEFYIRIKLVMKRN